MEKNLSFPVGDVQRIRVKLSWGQLEIVSMQGDAFQAIIAGDDDSVQALRADLSANGELLIAQPQLTSAMDLPRAHWLQACLRVPEGWCGDVDVDTLSGVIGAREVRAGDLTLSSVTGSINIRDAQAKTLRLHTVSGAIAGQALKAEKAELRSISGSITASELAFGRTKLFTLSGESTLSLEPDCKTVESQSVSGAVCLYVPGTVHAAFHSLSGQFLLADSVQTSDQGMEVSASSVSGDLAIKRSEEA